MNGKELFNKYTSSRDDYARTLLTALTIEGDNLYALLEQAEAKGKKIELISPLDHEIGPSDPYKAVISDEPLQ